MSKKFKQNISWVGATLFAFSLLAVIWCRSYEIAIASCARSIKIGIEKHDAAQNQIVPTSNDWMKLSDDSIKLVNKILQDMKCLDCKSDQFLLFARIAETGVQFKVVVENKSFMSKKFVEYGEFRKSEASR